MGGRIVFLNRVYPPAIGASGRVLADVARALVDEGWHVTVVCAGDDSRRHTDHLGVHVVSVRAPRARGFGALRHVALTWLRLLTRALSLNRRDLVVSLSDPPMLVAVGAIVAMRMGARHVHWSLDLYPELFPIVDPRIGSVVLNRLRWIRQLSCRRLDHTILISACMERRWREARLPGPSSVVEIWPDVLPAVSVETIKAFRERIGAGQHRIILYAGNLGLVHSFAGLLEVIPRFPDCLFVILGRGRRFAGIRARVHERGLANVRLLHWDHRSPDYGAALAAASIHLATMDCRALGLCVPSKVVTAAAMRRPTVFIGPRGCEPVESLTAQGMATVASRGVEEIYQAIRHRLMAADDQIDRPLLDEDPRRHDGDGVGEMIRIFSMVVTGYSAGQPKGG